MQAWTQVFCAWLCVIHCWGFVNSFGAFQTYYTSILPQSPSVISWIGSLQACLLFLIAAPSGRALDAGLFRPIVFVGIVLQIVGIFTLSAAKNYWQILLTQGVCTGLGGGLYFCPIMGVVSTYFVKKRAIAVALVTTGNSLGGLIYPIIVRQLLGPLGFGWTVRVIGFINVVSFAVVFAFMKPRLPPRKAGPLIDMDIFSDPPYMLYTLGVCFLIAPVYFTFYYVRGTLLFSQYGYDEPQRTAWILLYIKAVPARAYILLCRYFSADDHIGFIIRSRHSGHVIQFFAQSPNDHERHRRPYSHLFRFCR